MLMIPYHPLSCFFVTRFVFFPDRDLKDRLETDYTKKARPGQVLFFATIFVTDSLDWPGKLW